MAFAHRTLGQEASGNGPALEDSMDSCADGPALTAAISQETQAGEGRLLTKYLKQRRLSFMTASLTTGRQILSPTAWRFSRSKWTLTDRIQHELNCCCRGLLGLMASFDG